MKYAISTDQDMVSAHFGRCPAYTMLVVEDRKLVSRSEVPNPGHETGYIPNFLRDQGINVIIAGGMGWRAQEMFSQYKIQPILGVAGKIDDVVQQILDGNLQGGESTCSPGGGKGYGIPKKDGHGE
ncbi:MAG: NifB/NifX family molybdenum-iron cluster-binding protein [Candidatus Lokiarchaeota archaeon]|nr:NifB/NifX family molybdenum-iron cluster-binding protein [Candidatus Lokiarchaeota archaeon]